MPFTFSHPALIFPFRYFRKNTFSVTGLVVGSIVPDFEYFVRVKNYSHYSHTWKGVLWFDLPLAVVLCFLFQNIVRRQLILNSPYLLHIRFIRYYAFNWNKYFKSNWMIVLYSILIGTVSHLLWDRLTHRSYYFVTSIPLLKNIHYIAYHPLRVYRFFQSIYSTLGILFILVTIWYLPVSKTISLYKPDMRYWFLFSGIFTSAFTLIILTRNTLYVDYVISSISASIFSLFATSVVLLPHKRLLVSLKV